VSRPGGGRTPLLLGALFAAVVSVVVVWFLMPRTPDAFSTAENALAAGPQGPGSAAGLHVYTYFGAAAPPAPSPSPVPVTPSRQPSTATLVPVPATSGLPTPSPAGSSRSAKPSHRPSAPSVSLRNPVPGPPTAVLLNVGPGGLRTAIIGSDVAKAAAYSSTIAVATGRGDSFAVSPVADAGGPSAVPLLVAAALLAALACLSGALLGRRRTRWEPTPAAGDRMSGELSPRLPPGTEPIAGSELRQLRRCAQQKTALARSVAELVPSLPDALVWRAEQALADVGVRPVVPDGQPFDEAAHHVVGTEPVPRGGRENIIARTIRPGYADDENILVYPKVIVYAHDADGRMR